MYKTRVLFLVSVLTLIASLASAQYPIISAQDVRARMTGKNKVVVVDARSPEEYREAHIAGAINIPAEQMKAKASLLPKDKSVPIIFYCRGAGWSLSTMAAGAAMEMGYTYLMVYQAGMPDWLMQGYPVAKGAKPGHASSK